MITISSQNQKGTFERIVRANNGLLMRVRFEVYEINGTLKGRMVSIEQVSLLSGQVSDTTKCLVGACVSSIGDTKYVSHFAPVVSPYSELFFFTSQPTRAPSFV